MDEYTDEQTKAGKNNSLLYVPGIMTVVFLALGLYFLIQTSAPASFQDNTSFEIQQGMSVKDIATEAHTQGLVRSELFLYAVLTFKYDPTAIYAGTYIFTEPASLMEVAKKLANQDIENHLVRITLPEGIRATQIAEIANATLQGFDIDKYTALTQELEGYLFPETYFIPETFTAEDLLDLQKTTYEENVSSLRDDIQKTPFTEYEVLILASIIEREANDADSMHMVSGILQNRLDIGMALQADATIEYVLDTPLNELPAGQLASELRKKDSPYNTYLNRGLPPTPIGNPGIMAIEAAVHPAESDYFYYITGNDGVFYYAETFTEHNQNIAKHLR